METEASGRRSYAPLGQGEAPHNGSLALGSLKLDARFPVFTHRRFFIGFAVVAVGLLCFQLGVSSQRWSDSRGQPQVLQQQTRTSSLNVKLKL